MKTELNLLRLILRGGEGSGWFAENGHVPHNSTTQSMKRMLDNASKPNGSFHSLGSSGLWQKHFIELGYSEQEVKLLEDTLDSYGYGGQTQSNTESFIKENLGSGSRIGKLLEEQIKLETALKDKLVESMPEKLNYVRKKAEENFDSSIRWGINPYLNDTYYTKDEREDYVTAYLDKFKRDNGIIYRKGKLGKTIESWTQDRNGAVMDRSSGGIGYDHTIKLENLSSKGYRVLGGLAKIMGAPGESEVTLIKM